MVWLQVWMMSHTNGPELMDSQDDDEKAGYECTLTQKESQFSQLLNYRSIEEDELDQKKYATLHPMDRGLNQIGKLLSYSDINGFFLFIFYLPFLFVFSVLYTEFFGFGRNPDFVDFCDFHELASGESVRLLSSVSTKHCYIQRVSTSSYLFNVHLKVFMGKRRSNASVSVAIKVIAKRGLSLSRDHSSESGFGSSTELIRREVDIMLSIKHANCVQLEYVCESSKMAYIVMEYIEGGELFSRIVDERNMGKGLGEGLTKFYAWQMLNALQVFDYFDLIHIISSAVVVFIDIASSVSLRYNYCIELPFSSIAVVLIRIRTSTLFQFLHKTKIVHRDIKPENVLLLKKDVYTVLKLSDFGLSRAYDNTMQTFCGTQCYMAPELWKAEPRYRAEVDMWALGAVLFTCICGYPPFSNEYTDMPLKQQIAKGRLIYYSVWREISKKAQRLIRKMLRVDVYQRITAPEAIRDEWFDDPIVEKAKNLVQAYSKMHAIPLDNLGVAQ
ncbi:unnamed protein product [Anisakis simplex]|uniref:Serine/threonine-protein kinase Chk2 (inferred by orthology to a human protein) n=1 Tax=Anisakis simplex TaxID=6269 RepID=A0A0M3K7R4_ANISI|nr:unnamed protein product [Anisakis simplex]